MSVTVTIHNGELKRIRQLIAGQKKKKPSHGQLFGLWTHSNQPVIQYVVGDLQDGGEIQKFIWESHGLRHLGNWSTEEFEDDGTSNDRTPPSFVNMLVQLQDNGKVMNVKLYVFEKKSKLNGALETLEGHSAFRLRSPFSDQKDQKRWERYHEPPDKDNLEVRDLSEKPSCQAETKKEQWYSSEDGMQLFGKIHGALQEKFEITGTSRDTKTHDLCVTLKSKECEFTIEFPSNFPYGLATLTRPGNRREEIHLTETSSEEKQLSGVKGKNTPTPGKDKKNAKDVELQEHIDPEKIPQLFVDAIHCHLFGTKV